MTFISDELDKYIQSTRDILKVDDYKFDAGYYCGLIAAYNQVRDSEKELEKRIWQAWINEGVEPR